MDKPLIELRGVRKAFGSLQVLDGLDLAIEQGAVTVVMGRSGIGKSVLLKHMIGLIEPDGGEVLFRGKSLSRMRRAERHEMKRKLSYMFQNMALFDSMSIWENIALPLLEKRRLGRDAIRSRVAEKMEQLELGEVGEKYPSQISGGMRKRVALARALVTEPEVILFDEPTTGLDPIRKNTVHAMIKRYQQEFGFTAVVVSHDIPGVFQIAQKIAMLERGRILFEGTREEIEACERPEVQRFIHGEAEFDASPE